MKSMKLTALATAVFGALSLSANAAEVRTDGRLQITSDDKQFSARLRARLHADANFYNNDEVDHKSGAYIRRARIGVEGNVGVWKYEVTFDNATDGPDLKDAMLSTKFGPGNILFGQAKVREGLEQLTSSNDLTFMERSHVGNLVAGRQIGVGYRGATESAGYGFNVYSLREASDGGSRAIDDGWGGSGRVYFAPINDGTNAVHLGVSYAIERIDDFDFDGDPLGERARVRPAGRSNVGRFVVYDRRAEKVDTSRVNLEAAATMGAFTAQAEYMMGANSTDTRPDDDFTAWYLQASYAIGAHRKYDVSSGRMRAPHKAGTWEIAARYQSVERDITSEELENIDLGVTYYSNANVRFLVNYTTVLTNDQTDDKTEVVALRAQWAF